MKILYIIILLLTLASCNHQLRYMEHALKTAGTNRPEQEKLLVHYKSDTPNTPSLATRGLSKPIFDEIVIHKS